MTYKLFKEFIKFQEEWYDELKKLSDLGIDTYDSPIVTKVDNFCSTFLKESFNEADVDLIYWWIFEDVEKKIYLNDEEKWVNIEDIEDFWKYLDKNDE